MERLDAINRLNKIIGQDLRQLANQYGITVWSQDNRKNKGWAGHTIERYLGLPLNSSRSPDFGSWELKIVSLVARSKDLVVKETMAITMIDPEEVASKEFEESHLFQKLKKIVVVARIFESKADSRSIVHAVSSFDLDNDNPEVCRQVKEDYNLIRQEIRNQGFSSLTGSIGILIQPRTKGRGHGSTSRAFYARKNFVSYILGLKKSY